jgi:fucose 4-O-acetylase-like acetyltransferase
VLVVFCLSIAAGFFSEFGGLFSFSRTVCFSGFFLLGYYSDREAIERIRGKRVLILILGVITMVIIYVYCGSGMTEKTALAGSLTKSGSYKTIGMSFTRGFITRTITIPVSLILGSIVLAYTPRKRNICTTIGKNSIIILIFHKYFIMVFEKAVRETDINMHTITGMIILMIVSIGITLLLSLDIFFRIYRKTMGIIEKIIIRENG